MIEEEKYPKSDSYGVGDLQNSKMTGGLSCDLSVDLWKETISPKLAHKLKNHPIINGKIRLLLDQIVRQIDNK